MIENVTLAYHHQIDRLNQDIQINQYALSSLLGRGAHSVVRVCKMKAGSNKQNTNNNTKNNNNKQYAVKILWFQKIRRKYFIKPIDLFQMINNQVILLKRLNHPNIISYQQAIYLKQKQKQRMFIIMQYCNKGSMIKLINDNMLLEDDQWWKVVKGYIGQFVDGVEYLHKNNIIHRDIKPENLLINQDNVLKIIDFNISQEVVENGLVKITNKFIGTKGYAAPELLLDLQKQKQCDGRKIDIWAIGIMLLQLLQRRHPYPVKTLPQLIKVHESFKKVQLQGKILKQNQAKYRIQINQRFPEDVKDLLKKILRFQNQERCTIEEIAKHKWFKK